MTTGDTGTGTDSNYFKPWISDEEPRVPKDWGLGVFRGRTEPFICEGCNKPLGFREEYLYNYRKEGTVILHNKKECYESLIV